MSAETIDRRLQPFRLQLIRGFDATKPGSLIKSQVPVRIWTPRDEQRIGLLEIDLVAHCGISNRGQHLFTLVGMMSPAAGPLYGCIEQTPGRCVQCTRIYPWPPAFGVVRTRLRQRGEYLNSHLVQYYAQHRLTFTRSRPYWKNDQAHVEQKNWTIVRNTVGYDRYEGAEAPTQLNHVYAVLRLWTNHWQPVMKLVVKDRIGATLRKRDDVARTPTSGCAKAVTFLFLGDNGSRPTTPSWLRLISP